MKHIELLNEDVDCLHTYTLPCCNACNGDCYSNCSCNSYVCGAANVCGCQGYTCACNVGCNDVCGIINY